MSQIDKQSEQCDASTTTTSTQEKNDLDTRCEADPGRNLEEKLSTSNHGALIDNKPLTAVATCSSDKSITKPRNKILRNRYSKAIRILSKIHANAAAGRVDERDAADKIKYEAVVEEYKKSLDLESDANLSSTSERQVTATKRKLSEENAEDGVKYKKCSETAATGSEFANINVDKVPDITSAKTNAVPSPTHSPESGAGLGNDLRVALVNRTNKCGRKVQEKWNAIEGRLTEMVTDFLLNHPNDPPLLYDSSEVLRGCRIIKAEDTFSLEFLTSCVEKISEAWEGLSLQLIPAKEVPRSLIGRLCIPNVAIDKGKLLQCLRLQNGNLDLRDWQVLQTEISSSNGRSFLLTFPLDCLESIVKQNWRIRFGLRYAKLKVFTQPEVDQLIRGWRASC